MNLIKTELKFFFGDHPKLFDVLFINISTIIIGFVLVFLVPQIRENTTLLQKIIIIIIAWDDLGGVIANLTKSTNRFHAANKKMRYFFYSIHFIQPLVLFIFFEAGFFFFLFTWLYPVGSVIILEFLKEEQKNTIAGLLWLSGIIFFIYFLEVPVILLWFGITFLTKLIICYGINHFPETKK
ncbi:MAG: hypothetical protein MJB14_21995 [Spirochaetes bacterium]|nr:hypothetical protein [Spirochaetota bacterium]